MENKLLTALLPWRPVPGFEPSPEAFAPNVAFVSVMRRVIAQLWILVSCTQMRLTDAQRSSFPSEGRRALRRMDAAPTRAESGNSGGRSRFRRRGRARVTPLHGSYLGQPRLCVFVVPADSGDPGRGGLRRDVVCTVVEVRGVMGQHQVEIRDVDV